MSAFFVDGNTGVFFSASSFLMKRSAALPRKMGVDLIGLAMSSSFGVKVVVRHRDALLMSNIAAKKAHDKSRKAPQSPTTSFDVQSCEGWACARPGAEVKGIARINYLSKLVFPPVELPRKT